MIGLGLKRAGAEVDLEASSQSAKKLKVQAEPSTASPAAFAEPEH